MYENQTQIPVQKLSSYPNGGYAQASATMCGQVAPLDELAKQLESGSARISSLTDRIRIVADGLFGSQPEAKQGGNASIPPSGKIGGLNSQAATLLFWISELENQVARLNPLS